MPESPSSSAQAAREAVAQRLRTMRKSAGLTVTDLAGRCGRHHAKTSRIENARTAPNATNIRRWAGACGQPQQAENLIAQSLNAESMYREWRERVRAGMRQLQESAVKLFRETSLFRVYSSTLVPGLLQTEGYASALLSTIADFRQIPISTTGPRPQPRASSAPGSSTCPAAGSSSSWKRPRCTTSSATPKPWPPSSATCSRPARCRPSRWASSPSAVPGRRMWPQETFHVYDDRLVSVELLSAEVMINQPSEVALYVDAFERLRSMAVYGAEARALIVKAIDALR